MRSAKSENHLKHKPQFWVTDVNRKLGLFPSTPLLSVFIPILDLQPRDKAAMLGVNTIDFFLEEFTWK